MPWIRVKPGTLAASFGTTLIVIAGLAAATAAGTTGAWFSPAVSIQVYSAALFASIAIAVALGTLASVRAGRIDDTLRSLDLRIAGLPEAAELVSEDGVLRKDIVIEKLPPTDEDVDHLLNVLHDTSAAGPVAEIEITGTLMNVESAITANRSRKEFLKAALRQRADLEALRSRIPNVVGGPIGTSLVFAGAAGAMLPGSDGFAASHYALNTGLILFLGYGLAFLVAWTVASIAILHGRRA